MVEERLHRLGLREERDDGVLFGQHHHVLAERPVAAVAVATHPGLQAVAATPVRFGPLRVLDLHRRRLGDPALGQDPLAVPDAVVEVQLSEPGDGVQVREHTREAQVDARLVLEPAQLADADRVEHAASQLLGQALPVETLQDRRQREHRRLVVREPGARLVVRRELQEAAHRVGRVGDERIEQRLVLVARCHRGDVADRHPTGAFVGIGGLVRQVLGNQIIQRESTVADGEPEPHARERLAQRVHESDLFGPVRRPVGLEHTSAVTLDDQAVRLDDRIGLDRIEEGDEPTRVDAFTRWGARGERRARHVRSLPDTHAAAAATQRAMRGVSVPVASARIRCFVAAHEQIGQVVRSWCRAGQYSRPK